MTELSCRKVLGRLAAFHDDELPVGQQIAIAAHVEVCPRCAAELGSLRRLGETLRAGVAASRWLEGDDTTPNVREIVVGRAVAERHESLPAWVGRMFEDGHLVYAAVGATAATVACVVVMLAMMRYATLWRPDSLTEMVKAASPGSNENPVAVDARMLMPRGFSGAAMSAIVEANVKEDGLFALSATVTREGHVVSLALLEPGARAGMTGTGSSAFKNGSEGARLVEHLLDTASRARFEPAQFGGEPVAVNMVWVVARTTVRASMPSGLRAPGAPRKRAIQHEAPDSPNASATTI